MRPDQMIILLFCLVLVFLAALFLILPQNSFSTTEKRALQTKPRFQFSTLLSGKFETQIEGWLADQFPLREGFVGLKALFKIAIGQKQNNGILLGVGGQLARLDFRQESLVDRVDAGHLKDACIGIRRAAEQAEVPIVFLFPARNVQIAHSAFDYPNLTDQMIQDTLQQELSGCIVPDIASVLQEKYENGEAVIFRTDHHWTALGAYYAYCEVLRSFGRESDILPREWFAEEVMTNDFCGTYWNRGEMQWIAAEPVVVWHGQDDAEYKIFADGKELDGFYTQTGTGLGYEVFLDGTHDVVTIQKEGEVRPKLIVLKDSFANALAPFLARHFDLVLLNLSSVRHDYTNFTEFTRRYGAEYALVIYSISNLVCTDLASRLQ